MCFNGCKHNLKQQQKQLWRIAIVGNCETNKVQRVQSVVKWQRMGLLLPSDCKHLEKSLHLSGMVVSNAKKENITSSCNYFQLKWQNTRKSTSQACLCSKYSLLSSSCSLQVYCVQVYVCILTPFIVFWTW